MQDRGCTPYRYYRISFVLGCILFCGLTGRQWADFRTLFKSASVSSLGYTPALAFVYEFLLPLEEAPA
jgi:hypothetical protein